MFRNYFKTVIRQAARSRLYTAINLTGLSVAIACCFIIFLFIANEFSFDRVHKEHNKIYRITTQENKEGAIRQFAHSYLPLAPVLKAQLPEINEIVRILPQAVTVANKERDIVLQEEKFFYADSNFFNVFSFELEQGNITAALNDPNNILLTREAAKRYFGDGPSLGKQLLVEQKTVFTVAGILAEIPAQSSLQPDIIAPLSSLKQTMGSWVFNNPNKTWHYPPVYTFIKFSTDTDISHAEEKLTTIEKKFIPEHISKERTHVFQPLKDIHFSGLENEMQPAISRRVLYIFMAVAVVILLIAAFNFINLFFSRLVFRLRGVGIQKVMGADNRHIWWQTFAESIFFLLLSFVLSLLWISLFLPVFNNLMNRELSLFDLRFLNVWLLLLALLIALALLISVFPSFILFRIKLIDVLKGENQSLFPRKKTISLQSVFVVFQFVIAVALIIATIIMQSQMHYIRTKNLGLEKDQVLILPVRDEQVQEHFSIVKNKLQQIAGVKQVSAISNFPWEKGYYDFETTINTGTKTVKANAPTVLVGHDFIQSLNMTVVKGRDFSADLRTDSSTAFIMNETAAAQFGIKEPGQVKMLMENVKSGEPKQGELIGIVKDFHLQSLHQPVEPLILTISPEPYYIDNLIVKLSSEDIAGTLVELRQTMKEISPDRPFEYFFLDAAFEKLYQKETRLSSLFNYFSIIAIIIACLGLLGIVSFAAAQRLKEIGIRKVLGASIPGIVSLLSKDFLKLVIVAIILAIPLTLWVMNKWLEDFAYRVQMEWWVFLVAAVIALTIAFVTVSFQTIRAALSNPIKSLRSE